MPSTLHCHCLNILEVMGGEGPSLRSEKEKKNDPNRVNFHLMLFSEFTLISALASLVKGLPKTNSITLVVYVSRTESSSQNH